MLAKTPIYYQDVFISFILESMKTEVGLESMLRVYVAPGKALLQDTRWVFKKAIDEEGREYPAEAFTEDVEGNLHSSRVSVVLEEEVLNNAANSGLALTLVGQSNWFAEKPLRVPAFFVQGLLLAIDEHRRVTGTPVLAPAQ